MSHGTCLFFSMRVKLICYAVTVKCMDYEQKRDNGLRNLLIILWLILIGVIAVPVGMDYMNGMPKDDVLSVIQRETETDDIRITLEEEIGNKAMYCFRTGSDFGAAVFSKTGNRYCYRESTIGNGEKYIDVRLDTGWDVYRYHVTADGAQQEEIETYQGVYRIYLAAFLILAGLSLLYGFWSLTRRNKHKNQ